MEPKVETVTGAELHLRSHVTLIPTMKVTCKTTGAEMVINEADFNESLHEIERVKSVTKKKKVSTFKPSSHTAEQLAGMTKKELMKLPEMEHYTGEEPVSKDEVIKVILGVREEAAKES